MLLASGSDDSESYDRTVKLQVFCGGYCVLQVGKSPDVMLLTISPVHSEQSRLRVLYNQSKVGSTRQLLDDEVQIITH